MTKKLPTPIIIKPQNQWAYVVPGTMTITDQSIELTIDTPVELNDGDTIQFEYTVSRKKFGK